MPTGQAVEIDTVTHEFLETESPTFNIRVAEVSTYFVGHQTPILVHNANPNWNRPLWWLFGKRANFRPNDVDGVSMRRTESETDVIDMFKIRKGIEGRPSADPHRAYTDAELEANGIRVEDTPGEGPLEGRLQHGSARPADAPPDNLSPDNIQKAVDGINSSTPSEQATPKSMGCK
jgi:hypothetical protein